MKFVVFGAGYRGGRLFRYLGSDRILAFIDSDKTKQGTFFCQKKVISLEQYETTYSPAPIIISPNDYAGIVRILSEHKIYQYSILSEMPSEFSGYGKKCFDDCYVSLLKKYDCSCYLYGINAFSILLFEELKNRDNDVFFIQGEEHRTEWIKQNVTDKINEQPSIKGLIFLCCRDNINNIESQNVINAFDFTSNLPCYYNANVECLKAMFSEKRRCFIVATGPSLKESDLDKLHEHHEFCFGMNKIFKVKTEWAPDVYVITDSFLLKESFREIYQYNSPLKFIGDGNAYNGEENTYILHIVGGGHVANIPPPFSEDIAQKVYGGGTVTYACIQIAVYLGFKEIYLLGVDCNYNMGSKQNHFYGEDKPDMLEHDVPQMILAFQAAHEYASKHGIIIRNATRGGELEVFDRVDFDGLF